MHFDNEYLLLSKEASSWFREKSFKNSDPQFAFLVSHCK